MSRRVQREAAPRLESRRQRRRVAEDDDDDDDGAREGAALPLQQADDGAEESYDGDDFGKGDDDDEDDGDGDGDDDGDDGDDGDGDGDDDDGEDDGDGGDDGRGEQNGDADRLARRAKRKQTAMAEAAAETASALKRSGVVYLSRVPPTMKPLKLRSVLSAYGAVGRLFLTPASRAGPGRAQRRRTFVDGWVEFADKRVAKRLAASLNNSPMGGPRWCRDVIWNIRYLSGFKWTHLKEQIAYQKAVRDQKLRAEIAQAKRENSLYMARVEKAKSASHFAARHAAKDAATDAAASTAAAPPQAAAAAAAAADRAAMRPPPNVMQRRILRADGASGGGAAGDASVAVVVPTLPPVAQDSAFVGKLFGSRR